MRIGIDARFWDETGVGRYIRHIVEELSIQDQGNHYVVFLLDKDFEGVSLPENFEKVRANVAWHSVSEQLVLPFLYSKQHLDLLFIPQFNVPIFYPGKFVVTIHDLTPLKVRTGRVTTLPYPIYLVKYLGAAVAFFVAAFRSRKVFTVSENVKKELSGILKISPKKILVTPCAVDSHFNRRTDSEVREVLKKYNIQYPYLFYVGNAYPHKNLERLIKAFEIVLKSKPDLNLVLGGKKNFFYDRLEQECAKLDVCSHLVFPGFIDDADLPALYSGAEAFVNPSLYEGFGIQTLEAFACGCKVICSNTTSLPEVGGDLASYFNPTDVQSIAQGILTGLNNSSPEFITRAAVHTQNYSWRSSARAILETFKSL